MIAFIFSQKFIQKIGMVQKTQEVSLTLSGFCTQTQKSQWVINVGTTG